MYLESQDIGKFVFDGDHFGIQDGRRKCGFYMKEN